MPEKVELIVDINFVLAAADPGGRGRHHLLQAASRISGLQTYGAARTSASRAPPAVASLPQSCRSRTLGRSVMDPVRTNTSSIPVSL